MSAFPGEAAEVETWSLKEISENWDIYVRPEADDQFPSLVDSVRTHGILQPLTISSDFYILSGHRRLAAAIEAGLDLVPVIMTDIEISPMSSEERIKVLVAHNRGSRVKTNTELIAEAMSGVDPAEAISAAAHRKADVFTSVKTSHELIRGVGGSRRTDPKQQRGEFLDAVLTVLEDLRDRQMLPISARHIHYKLLAGRVRTSTGRAGHPYGTKQSDSKLLNKLLTDARSRGFIPDSWISDDTRPTFNFSHHNNIGEYVAGVARQLLQKVDRAGTLDRA